jgi:hypothetical protein
MCYPDVCMDDLTARLARDVDTAFADLMATHQDLVFGVALRVVGNRATAEDVAQEAFVRAYRALKGYPASAHPGTAPPPVAGAHQPQPCAERPPGQKTDRPLGRRPRPPHPG